MKTLLEDLEVVKTNKFFVFHAVDPTAVHDLERRFPGLPAHYMSFLSTFGWAQLYRDEFGGYNLGVSFIEEKDVDETDGLLMFGWIASKRHYFQLSRGKVLDGIHVRVSGKTRRTNHVDFEQWFEEGCRYARELYTKREWERVLKGPRPFSARERRIVDARRKFKIERFEQLDHEWIYVIRNESDVTLPYLSVGVRSKDSPAIQASGSMYRTSGREIPVR